ncbi:MAG: hypothetical protein WC054_13145, partial [Candidatus Nanopelagicales bacterium]
DDLRDAIFDLVIERTTASINEAEALADAVLAMPEIVDMLALKRIVNGLTVEQVARAIQLAQRRLNWMEVVANLTDDEKAIASWTEPT